MAVAPALAAVDPTLCNYRRLVPEAYEYVAPNETARKAVDLMVAGDAARANAELAPISASKLAQVLGYMHKEIGLLAPDREAVKNLIRATAANPERLAEATLYMKEFPLSSTTTYEGANAAYLLRRLEPAEAEKVLVALEKRDKKYAANVRRQLKAISEAPFSKVGVRSSVELLPDPIDPPPKKVFAILGREPLYREALQHEYLIGENPGLNFIGTRFISHCVAFTLYNPKTKKGVVAHLDAGTDVYASLDHVFADIRAHGWEPKDFEAQVLGGLGNFQRSWEIAYEMRNYFELQKVKVGHFDIGRSLFEPVSSVVLDLKTGKVYNDRRRDQTAEDSLRQYDLVHRPKSVTGKEPLSLSPHSLTPAVPRPPPTIPE